MNDELLELMRERIAIGLKRPDTREAIQGWDRKVLLKLKDGRRYHFIVESGNLTVEPGAIDEYDMVIESDEETVRKLFLEEMSAAAALVKRKLKVKGSPKDLMRIRKIF